LSEAHTTDKTLAHSRLLNTQRPNGIFGGPQRPTKEGSEYGGRGDPIGYRGEENYMVFDISMELVQRKRSRGRERDRDGFRRKRSRSRSLVRPSDTMELTVTVITIRKKIGTGQAKGQSRSGDRDRDSSDNYKM